MSFVCPLHGYYIPLHGPTVALCPQCASGFGTGFARTPQPPDEAVEAAKQDLAEGFEPEGSAPYLDTDKAREGGARSMLESAIATGTLIPVPQTDAEVEELVERVAGAICDCGSFRDRHRVEARAVLRAVGLLPEVKSEPDGGKERG